MYNILFTAFPIMWFALFDQEFQKDELLEDPKHFKIGLKSNFSYNCNHINRSKFWKMEILEMDFLWYLSNFYAIDYWFLFT